MLVEHDLHGENGDNRSKRTVFSASMWMLIMNVVLSFDTVSSATAPTDVCRLMLLSIVLSGILMEVMAGHVARFPQPNWMQEVLGLFALLLVGIMLMSEGGRPAHLVFFGYATDAVSKAMFCIVQVTMVPADVVQGHYQRRIMAEAAAHSARPPAAAQ